MDRNSNQKCTGEFWILPDQAATSPTSPISPFPSLNEMPLLRSATLLATSWRCHQWGHSNDLSKNKRRCSLCQSRRNGLAPLSAKGDTSGTAVSNAGLVNNDASCHDKNDTPNNASPRRGGSLTKSGIKRKSPSQGLGIVLCPLTPQLP
jgi:hypothetical protein